MRLTIIQMNSGVSKSRNLAEAERLVREAVGADRSDIVALPEMFACLTGNPAKQHESAESIDDGPTVAHLSMLAKQLNIFLHAGSLIEKDGDEYFNTTVVFDGRGDIIARYRKIHLFDVVLPDGTEILESKGIARGNDVVSYVAGETMVGCSICYDLRFPEVYRQLRDMGADVVMVPSAFTFQTGADHWECLLRARAIETQCYVAAPSQVLSFDDGKYMNFGHAMIVDPWGQVVAQVSNKVGWATATVDHDWIATVRARIPVHNHRVLG